MNLLSEKHPAIFAEFCPGKFFIYETSSQPWQLVNAMSTIIPTPKTLLGEQLD